MISTSDLWPGHDREKVLPLSTIAGIMFPDASPVARMARVRRMTSGRDVGGGKKVKLAIAYLDGQRIYLRLRDVIEFFKACDAAKGEESAPTKPEPTEAPSKLKQRLAKERQRAMDVLGN